MNREELNNIINSNTEVGWQSKNIIEAVNKYVVDVCNKAIDDYRNSIKEELNRFDVKNLDTCVLFDFMDRKAEQLKEGEKNE